MSAAAVLESSRSCNLVHSMCHMLSLLHIYQPCTGLHELVRVLFLLLLWFADADADAVDDYDEMEEEEDEEEVVVLGGEGLTPAEVAEAEAAWGSTEAPRDAAGGAAPVKVLPLYGMLSKAKQDLVFGEVPDGYAATPPRCMADRFLPLSANQ